MERKNGYIFNLGLAFDEDRVIKKLSKNDNEDFELFHSSAFTYGIYCILLKRKRILKKYSKIN